MDTSLKTRTALLPILALIFLLAGGCSGGGNTGTVSVEGLIRDSSGQRLEQVEAFNADGVLAISDASGRIEFTIAPQKAGSIRLRKAGYAAQTVMLKVADERATFAATLGRRGPAIAIDAAQPVDMTGDHGARVALAANALVDADGNPVSGEVELTITPVDISDDNQFGVFPGAFAGIDASGDAAPVIMSYGTVEYRFTQNGRELNLAAGQTATVEIPVFVTIHPDGSPIQVGDPGALWYLDESTGLWQQQGAGTVIESPASPTGLALKGSVSHFSWWNHDIAPEICEMTFLSTGLPNGAGYRLAGATQAPMPRTASTAVGSDGISLIMPEGNSVELSAIAETDEGVYRASLSDSCDGASDSTSLAFEGPESPFVYSLSGRTQAVFGLELDPDNPADTRWVLEGQDALIDWATGGADLLTLTSDQGHETTLGNDSGSIRFPLELNGSHADSYLFTLSAESIDGGEAVRTLTLDYVAAPAPIIHRAGKWQTFANQNQQATIYWEVEAADRLRIVYAPYLGGDETLLLEESDIPQDGAIVIDPAQSILPVSGPGYYRLTLEFVNQYGSSSRNVYIAAYEDGDGDDCGSTAKKSGPVAEEYPICE